MINFNHELWLSFVINNEDFLVRHHISIYPYFIIYIYVYGQEESAHVNKTDCYDIRWRRTVYGIFLTKQ